MNFHTQHYVSGETLFPQKLFICNFFFFFVGIQVTGLMINCYAIILIHCGVVYLVLLMCN